jgi:septal ring factor EnvC (AmiA/AmiB activator)
MFKKIAILFLMITLSWNLCAQKTTKESLQKDKQRLEENIKQNQSLLDQTKSKQSTNLTQLKVLQNQINSYTDLIKNMSDEITMVENDIKNCENNIAKADSNIRSLKNEYALMLVSVEKQYKNKISQWLFIFASKDFQQAVRRYRFFTEYNENLENQVKNIEKEQKDLIAEKEKLDALRNEKRGLLSKQEVEKKQLDQQKTVKDNLQKDLQKQEKTLKASIKSDQDKANKLNKKIEDMIKADIEAERKKAADAAKKNGTAPPASGSKLKLTPEETKLNQDFASNKGKLPYPCKWGSILNHFGTHAHPTLKGIQVTSLGIDILTNENSACLAIFDGVVTSIFASPANPNSKVVVVKHGTYRTVYANLSTVSVTSGQKVSLKQSIGTIFTDPDTKQTVISFQIWQDIDKLDPEKWLLKM